MLSRNGTARIRGKEWIHDQRDEDGGRPRAPDVQIEYPGLPATEILAAVHDFYDAYYFRPKAAYRILRKAVFNNSERKRLYKEARTS